MAQIMPTAQTAKKRDMDRKRADAAWFQRDRWNAVLLDAYTYLAPTRLSTHRVDMGPQGLAPGMFDPTAAVSLARWAKRITKEFFSGEWLTLEGVGPDGDSAADEQQREQFSKEAAQIGRIVNRVCDGPQWGGALLETLLDAGISTGFLLVTRGQDIKRPVRFVAVSMDECALDLGPYRDISGVFWRRKWQARAIAEAWPNGTFSETLQNAINDDGDKEFDLAQDCTWQPDKKRWRNVVYLRGEDAGSIHEETSRKNPWVVTRLTTMPGQPFGFGPALMALPFAKTASKTVELTLASAALTIAAPFTYVDDGVFNPDLAEIKAGAFWPVQRNGGPFGPSISRLPPPNAPSLENMVLQDLRQGIQAMLEDTQLPPDGQTPRSAVEIAERIKRSSLDQTGDERLLGELAIPIVDRVLEILADHKLIADRLDVDGITLKVALASPKARAMRASAVEPTVQWLQMVGQFTPGALGDVTNLQDTLAEIGRDMGVPDRFILPKAERDQKQQDHAQAQVAIAQAQAQAAQAEQAQAAPNGAPAQMSPPLPGPPGVAGR